MLKHANAILFLIFLLGRSQAQIEIHHHQSVEDGLVYSQVLNIIEDRQGYLWLGTTSGLSRWDGIQYTNFQSASGLPSSDIQHMALGPDSLLYCGTRRGLAFFQNGRFETPAALKQNNDQMVTALQNLPGGALAIGYEDSSCGIYNGRTWRKLHTANEVIVDFCSDQQNGLFALYANGKIARLSGAEQSVFKTMDIFPVRDPRTFYYHPQKIFYIGTADGLWLTDGKQKKHFTTKEGLPGNFINHIVPHPDGRVFVATDGGVAVFDGLQLSQTFTPQQGLSNPFVWCIYINKKGTVYLGTDGSGFDYFRPGLWHTIDQRSGLRHNTVWSILELSDGSTLLATDAGVQIYKNFMRQPSTYAKQLAGEQILSSCTDRQGNLYLAGNQSGLHVFHNGHYSKLTTAQGLPSNDIWAMAHDTRDHIYVGTYGKGIAVLDQGQVIKHINAESGLPSEYIVSIRPISGNGMLIGTDGGGAVLYRNSQIEDAFLAGTTVWTAFEDSLQNLYFGCNELGLVYRRQGKWDTLSTADGLTNNSVLGILQDSRGDFYLTTDNGLNIVRFEKNAVRVRRIDSRDGLAGNEFNQGAYFKDRKGRLWFGTTKGVSVYSPWNEIPNPSPPPTLIQEVSLFGRPLPLGPFAQDTSFAWNQNLFQFAFTGIDLEAASKLQYRHFLEGVDQNWVKTSSRSIQYTNLAPGAYTFRVKSANAWGRWGQEQHLHFTITPPFWKSWWFMTLSASLFIGLAWFLIALRVRRLLAMERLRASIAADLHDDIGSGLSEISILCAVAESHQQTGNCTTSELEKIGHTARSLIDRMNDIVWLVNPRKDTLYDMLAHLSASYRDTLHSQGIELRSHNLEALNRIHLPLKQRQNLYLIFREAINNALKYSRATEVEISATCRQRRLTITLRDNGIGLPEDGKRNGNGLINMQQRAVAIGGKLQISSQNGQGTIISYAGKGRRRKTTP